MFADPKAAAERLKALAKLYGAELPGKLDELESLASQLSGAGPFDETRQRTIEASELAHKIAGTAGSFGYQEVTDGARVIEESLRTILESGRPLTAEQAARIIGQIGKLKKLGSETPGRGSGAGAEPGTTATGGNVDKTRRSPGSSGSND